MKELHPPQVAHVARLLDILSSENNSAADLSKCGLGKTVCASEIARFMKRPFFVAAPLSTLPAWREELTDRGVKPLGVTNYEQLRSKKCPWTEKVGGLWRWKNLPLDTIICLDEAQRLKSRDSIISKIAVAAKPFTTLMLSGSIAENPLHLRACGYLLGLHSLRDYWKYCKERGCYIGPWGLEFGGKHAHLSRIHNEIIPAHGSQMNFEEMKKFMPDNQILFEQVDFGDAGKIARLYAEMEAELLALAETAASDSRGAEILTAQLRARQQAELLKVPLFAERAQDLAAEGNSVVVFMCFTASLKALSERLGGIPLISGEHGDRNTVIQDFQRDKTPILGANVAAGGVGINLHGKRPRRTLLTPSFNPIDIIQAIGRAPRVGGGAVVQHVLTAAGTIEEQVQKTLQKKLAHIDIINTGEKKVIAKPLTKCDSNRYLEMTEYT